MEKLVRDGIPEVMRAAGKTASFRIASADERLPLLFAKLREETQELEGNPSADELADILEVIRAIQSELAISDKQLQGVQSRKLADRGAFQAGIVLFLDQSPDSPAMIAEAASEACRKYIPSTTPMGGT